MPQNYKVVRNLPSGLAYILHHCGTPAVFADLPADAVGSPVFKVPVGKWSSGATTTYNFLEELDLWPHAAVVDNEFMSSACGQKLVGCGVVGKQPEAVCDPWFPLVCSYNTSAWIAAVTESSSEVHLPGSPPA